MLSTKIKEATTEAHQNLEGKVVRKLKAIRSNDDYADLLKYCYAYFNALEQAVAPYITAEILPNHASRRHSGYIKADIEELGSNVNELPAVTVPAVNNLVEALGALYVMEGSIMGGPYIVQMLAKGGINTGVSFFSGYGEQTGRMWGIFTEVLNNAAQSEKEEAQAVKSARETFANFAEAFTELKVA